VLKAAKGLKMLYQRMVYLTCLAHGFPRVAEHIRGNCPENDSFNGNVREIFLRAPLRVGKFKLEAPSLPLPPQQVPARWGTWLGAAMCYCKNHSTIDKIFTELDSNEVSSIKFAKELFYSGLFGNLAYIKSNLVVI
jgi:hypothetical protein